MRLRCILAKGSDRLVLERSAEKSRECVVPAGRWVGTSRVSRVGWVGPDASTTEPVGAPVWARLRERTRVSTGRGPNEGTPPATAGFFLKIQKKSESKIISVKDTRRI